MPGQRPRRASYLLRLWRVEDDGKMIWRASLQNPDTGERRGFSTVADLLSFLEAEYGAAVGSRADSIVDTL